jgi:drug/metabolite transporter (DMT)-like permease
MIDLIILYVISAGLFTFGKQAVMHTSSFFLSATRLIPSGVIFLAWAYFTEKKQSFILKGNAFVLLLLNGFFFYVMDGTRFISLEQIASSYAALISAVAPYSSQ